VANCGRLFSLTMTHKMMSALEVQNLFQSSLEEAAELSDYRQRDKDAFWSDIRAICRLDAVIEQIESISRARADQRVKDMAGHKSFEEYPDKKIKCEMDIVWRQQHNLKREYHLTNQQGLPLDRAE